MITPTRFGLKYAPIPTLALEYEDDLRSIDDGATTSLYVYNGGNDNIKGKQARSMKKLHVVELPALTKHSEAVAVARQLQQDNQRFLSPAVVKEDQLVRLLERLMAHLQATEISVSPSQQSPPQQPPSITRSGVDNGVSAGGGRSIAAMAGKLAFGTEVIGSGGEGDENGQESESESELEASASMDISRGDDNDQRNTGDDDGDNDDSKSKSVIHDRFQQHDGEDAAIATGKPVGDSAYSHNQEARDQSGGNDNDVSAVAPTTKPSSSASDDEDDARETQDDAAKRKALRSESEASDDNEEDIQSEELEYFSEDASDEDSF